MNREIKELKEALDKKEKEQERAAAIRDKMMEELKEEFGIEDIADAEKLLLDLRTNIKDKTEELNAEYEDFIENYGEALEID